MTAAGEKGGRPRADLSDRVVLVTGGAGGIGAAVALEAARAGAAVAVAYRTSAAAADAVVDRIRAAGGRADAFSADLARLDEAKALVAAVEDRLGPVAGLVNSAAVMVTGGFLETAESDWEHVIRNDLYSVVFACQAVLPGMLERRAGAIVNVSSRLAAVGAPDASAYAAIKAAVLSLTRSLAAAYGPGGVRVNAVAPGTVNTEMGRSVVESPEGRERQARIPLRRFAEPEEVAAPIVFLLSDASAAFAGQTFHASGGELMP